MKKYLMIFVVSIDKLKTLKYHTFFKKTLVRSIVYNNCENKDKQMFKEEELTDIKNSWFDWKYIITLKVWRKKMQPLTLDRWK